MKKLIFLTEGLSAILAFIGIKLLFQAMQTCRDLAMNFGLVGNAQIISECKGFEDTRGWTFYESIDDAKAGVGRTSGAATASAPQLEAVG